MQLPSKKFGSTKPKEPPKKYSDSSVKMFANALDDLMMIKWKAGWFTVVKYDIALQAQKKKDREQWSHKQVENWMESMSVAEKADIDQLISAQVDGKVLTLGSIEMAQLENHC